MCCGWNAEMMVKAYMTSYKLPCIITRGNNVYGPHQFPEKLVPKFTLLAKRGEQLPVHGGGQVRQSCLPLMHVHRCAPMPLQTSSRAHAELCMTAARSRNLFLGSALQ